MIDQEIKKTLSQIQLLSFLNEETLQSLTENAKSVTYTRGQKIVTKGKSIDNFYIIQSGELKSIDEINGDEIILANFHKGEFFGERALIKNEPAYATIKAVTDVELIEISKELFLEIIESNNAIKKYVKDFLFNRAMHNFLRKFSLFGEMEAEEVTNWFKLLHYETAFNDKEIVFNEGDEADKFYILVKGNVDVIMHNKTISTLHEGEFFGELAIINNQPRAATIQANGKVLLVSLSKEHFEKLIKKSPELNQKIRTVIDMYRTNTDDIDEVASSLEPEFDPLSIKNQLESVEIKPNLKTFFGKKKYPFEKQFNQTDSISACISMVSKYYNKEISLTRIRDLASIEEHVKSLMSVSYAAEHLGFNTKVIDVEMNDFSNMQTPFIAKISKGQFVVVYEVHAQHLLIANPASGISKISVKDFESFYEKSILSMEPTSAFIGQKNSSSSMTRFLVLLSPYKKLMTEIFIVSLLVSIFGLGAPIFTRLVIDNIVVHHNESLLNTMMVGMLMVGVFLGISVALRTYLVTYLGNKVQMQMLGQFYKHILSLPMSFFAKKKVGDIMSRFNESARVQQMLTGASLGMFIDVIMVVVYVAVMFSFNSTLAFMILGFILAVAIVTISFTGMMKSISKQGFSKNAQADALLVESLSGVMTIKATSSELQSRWKWEDLFIESLQLRSKTSMINAISQSLGQSLKLFAVVILLWYGTILVMEGEMTVGQVMAFNMLVMMSMGPIQKVLGMWNEIQETMMSVARLNDIYDLEPEEKLDSENLEHLPPIKGHVKFEKVSFAYTRAGGYILKNVSFEVPQGQKVAIVGRSGGGKSTLINLLLRFNDVSDGKITIDGFNIAHTSIYSLRKQIGTVLQESHLFNGTIKENIALAKPDASFSEIIKAAELAAAHDFISSLPMGYNTVIGERGAGLSGGQRQRISIARTLLTNPKILVMDEATSALDNESERAIQNNLGEITKGRTTFIIAHRLSTVRDADVILVMDKGYVAEMGSHDELIQKRGLYFYLNNTSLSLS